MLLSENEENCASLSNENVTEVVDLVDTAIIVSENNINIIALARCSYRAGFETNSRKYF